MAQIVGSSKAAVIGAGGEIRQRVQRPSQPQQERQQPVLLRLTLASRWAVSGARGSGSGRRVPGQSAELLLLAGDRRVTPKKDKSHAALDTGHEFSTVNTRSLRHSAQIFIYKCKLVNICCDLDFLWL